MLLIIPDRTIVNYLFVIHDITIKEYSYVNYKVNSVELRIFAHCIIHIPCTRVLIRCYYYDYICNESIPLCHLRKKYKGGDFY